MRPLQQSWGYYYYYYYYLVFKAPPTTQSHLRASCTTFIFLKSLLKTFWKKGRRMDHEAETRRQTEEEKESMIGKRNPYNPVNHQGLGQGMEEDSSCGSKNRRGL